MTVLLTRPKADSQRIAERLGEQGIATEIWPLGQVVMLSDRIEIPSGTDALIFTSANGIRAFAALSQERWLPVLTVGGRTAEVARSLGFADTTSADGNADALVALAAGSDNWRFFYPRGREVAADLAGRLQAEGKSVTEAIVYGIDPPGPPERSVSKAFETGQFGVVTIWSQQNARILAEQIATKPGWQIARTDLVAISESASRPLANAGFRRVLIAAKPDAEAMVDAISAALRQ